MKLHRNLPKFNDSSYAHFVTTKTCENYPYFRDERLAGIVKDELDFYAQKHGFDLLGYVIMPDHLHLLVWWDVEAKPDLTISKIMQNVKGASARKIIDSLKGGLEHPLQPRREQMLSSTPKDPTGTHRQKLKYRVWQSGFYDFNVYTDAKLTEKLDYMHGNPVKAGVVSALADYQWSSYGDYFNRGNN